MENVQIQNKIKMLFEKMVEPDYVMNNYYADGLINKLSNCADPEIAFLKSIPLMSDLIINALNGTETAHNTVKVFLTRLLAIVSTKELHFAKMFSKNGDGIVRGFQEINSPSMNPSLRVAYMEVALAISTHNSGISWLLETGVWKEILSLCNEKRTVFVVRQTYKFASNFLWKLNDLGDEANIRKLLFHILKPLSAVDFVNLQSMTSQDEEEISKTLEPMLQILLSVVTENNRIGTYSILISAILNDFKVTYHLYMIFDRMRREDITLLIAKLIFWQVISKIFLTKPMMEGVVYKSDEFMDLSVMYFNTIQMLIQRRSPTLVLDFCNVCNLIWNQVWKDKKHAFEREGTHIDLQNQLLFICLVPCLVYVKKVENSFCSMTYERLNEYIVKLLNSTCEHTAKAAYALRDLTLELDTVSVTLQSVKRLTCIKNHLNNEQANLVFQALFFILKEYEPTDNRGEDIKIEEDFEDSQEKVQVMTYVLDTVLCLVKNHNINWHESLEVICLFSVVYNILKRPNLTCKFVVTALNLISVTIKKFIPPNLSLLLEAKPGSSMNEIGKLIYIKMHDRNWEVRDSALELLLVCTEIAFIKFPPFQKQITENNLINVAATIALNDHEFYVQASALKCLGAANKINVIWEQLKTQYPNVQEQLILILRNNQEGIVRKEACNVLCEIYQNIKLTQPFKQILYEHMVSSALSDFHWEVQLTALRFWKIVIQTLLNDQGMLDGTFPPVTFSKESRKIVTLNENEIKKRLTRILDELASIGCLTVLVKLLYEDSDVDILDSALTISVDLLNILVRYKVPEHLRPNDNSPATINELLCNIRETDEINMVDITEPETSLKADNVIESIINADDINLLSNIYERHMKIQNEKSEESIKPKIKLIKCASPYLFVNFLGSKDFKAVVEQKKKWKDGIKNVSSLLDDVLGIYEVNGEVNTMDCY